jgi:hypothetical protein
MYKAYFDSDSKSSQINSTNKGNGANSYKGSILFQKQKNAGSIQKPHLRMLLGPGQAPNHSQAPLIGKIKRILNKYWNFRMVLEAEEDRKHTETSFAYAFRFRSSTKPFILY